MDDPGVDGAVAAATYFLTLFPYALKSGDLAGWTALSHPECVFCASVAMDVEEMRSLGQHQAGADVTLVSASGSEVDPGVWFGVDLVLEQDGWRVVDDVDAVVREDAATYRYSIHLSAVRDSDRWLIREATVTVDEE
jgi:hypothetical protein